MISDEDLDRLAGILYAAYEREEGNETAAWEELKREYPALAPLWRRVAEAAVRNVVVVKICAP